MILKFELITIFKPFTRYFLLNLFLKLSGEGIKIVLILFRERAKNAKEKRLPKTLDKAETNKNLKHIYRNHDSILKLFPAFFQRFNLCGKMHLAAIFLSANVCTLFRDKE